MSQEDPLRALWQTPNLEESRNMSLETVLKRSASLVSRARVRLASETAGGLLSSGFFAWVGLATHAPYVKGACALLVAGALVVIVFLWRGGRPHPAPPLEASTKEHLAHCRAELARERDLLGSVERWYIAPVVPGLLALPVAICVTVGAGVTFVSVITVVSVVGVCAIVIAVNHRASRRLGQELAALGTD